MNRTVILTLAIATAATSALAESLVLEDYNGNGLLSGKLYVGKTHQPNSVDKHAGYARIKWEQGYVFYTTVGKQKVNLGVAKSLSFDYRTTKKGENFDADRAVEIKLYVLENGVQKGFVFRFATDSLIDDGDWHRVCVPMSEFVAYDKVPAKDMTGVYSFSIGVNDYSVEDKDKIEIDLKDITAHTEAVDGVKQIAVEAPKDAAGKAANP